MGIVSPGFSGHRRTKEKLPPGQYLVHDFPVLSAGLCQLAVDLAVSPQRILLR